MQELFFDESLKQVLTFGESLHEEEGDLVKHPKSKTVAVTERDLGNCDFVRLADWNSI